MPVSKRKRKKVRKHEKARKTHGNLIPSKKGHRLIYQLVGMLLVLTGIAVIFLDLSPLTTGISMLVLCSFGGYILKVASEVSDKNH